MYGQQNIKSVWPLIKSWSQSWDTKKEWLPSVCSGNLHNMMASDAVPMTLLEKAKLVGKVENSNLVYCNYKWKHMAYRY
jgi:hypothetical protein